MSVTVFCHCKCHRAPDADWQSYGVDTRDPIAAAEACRECINRHCDALADDEPPSSPLPYLPPQPWPGDATGISEDVE